MQETKPFQSLATVAREIGVPEKWLQDEARAGRVPVLRAGARWLANVEAVQRALLERSGVAQA